MPEPLPEDYTYHGFRGENDVPRIVIEEPKQGKTEHHRVLGEFPSFASPDGGLGWGYDGDGPSRAAAEVLAHALELGAVAQSGMAFRPAPQDKVRIRMREAFCQEVLTQLPDTWRLRRCVVLRWAHSWYLQQAPDAMPPVLQKPISVPPTM